MSLYELDPYNWDDFVQTLQFPPTTATLACPDANGCFGESDWVDFTSRDPAWTPYAFAKMRLRVWGDLIATWW